MKTKIIRQGNLNTGEVLDLSIATQEIQFEKFPKFGETDAVISLLKTQKMCEYSFWNANRVAKGPVPPVSLPLPPMESEKGAAHAQRFITAVLPGVKTKQTMVSHQQT